MTLKLPFPNLLTLRRRWQWFIALSLSVMLCITTPAWANQSAQQDVQRLDAYVQQAIVNVQTGDLPGAAAQYQQFRTGWGEIEDGVKVLSRSAYRDIEDAMGEVKYTLSIDPVDPQQVRQSLEKLHGINQQFMTATFEATSSPQPAAPTQGAVSIATLLNHLQRAEQALDTANIDLAAQEIKGFQTDWVEVEGVVAAKSRDVYTATENNMARAYALLKSTPPKVSDARVTIAQLRTDLQPFNTSSLRYTFLDATLILLREGVEALLVLIALLAFLVKSDNAEKGRWIWIGAGGGILASVITALIIQLIFSNIPVGTNRELLEGITGLVAAAMLFYVSYWLHSKSSMGAWQGYIKEKATAALASNSVLSLALLAFLAVYREGAETVLFYIGIAPSISMTDLVGGLALGLVILGAIAALMLGVGLRIPLKPFFLVTSVLIYYLGFKFVGSGIHALQVAHWLPANTANFLPASDSLGLYPTWETTLAQGALLIAAVLVVVYTRSQSAQTATAPVKD